MRTAIIYYSMNGNTAMAAKKLADELKADMLEIAPEKAYPNHGVRKFLWGGKSAVMAETPKLKPYSFHPDNYDQVIFGFPVWASNVAPPIRTFVKENRERLRDKQIAAFACQSGNGAEKAFARLLDSLGRDAFRTTMILIDPKDKPNAETDQKISMMVKILDERQQNGDDE